MSAPLYERIGGRESLLKFLHHFYSDVRQHSLIGPIFNSHIDDWPAHIRKIAEFWARVMGVPSLYAGQMPLKHIPLQLDKQHFAAWLDLWDFNCRKYFKAEEAAEMSEMAHNIGARLFQIVTMHRASGIQIEPQRPS